MANSVEFLINIQQRMSGANATTELQKLEAAIKTGGSVLKEYEGAVEKAAAQLQKLGAAIEQQRGALAKAQAGDDTKAMDRAAAKLQALTQKYKEHQAVLGQAQGKLDGHKAHIEGLADKFVKMNGAQDATTKGAAGLSDKMGETAGALGQLGGPLGQAGGGVFQLGDAFSKLKALGPVGIVIAVVVAVVALGAALAVAVVAMARFALKAADAARQTALSAEVMLESGDAARSLVGDMRRIESATGVAADRQLALAKQLRDAKVPADQMGRALRALAIAEAAGATDAIAGFVTDLKSGAKGVDELATEIDKRFGSIAARRMLGLDKQTQKLSRDFDGLFEGVDAEPTLRAMQDLLSLFDENTASGRAMREVLGALFQPLIDSAAVVFPIVKKVLQGMLIAALQLYIALKPIGRAIADTFGMKPGDGLETALEGGKKAFYAMAAVAALLFVALLPIIVLGAGIVVALGLIAYAIGWVVGVAVDLVGAFSAAYTYISTLDWGALGKNIITGLVNGITSGAGAVISAITGVANGAIASAKAALGIASPSTVFAEIGGFTAQGMAVGVEDGAPAVESAVARVVEAPSADRGGAARRGGGGGGGITGNTFNFYGVKDAADSEDRLEAMLTNLLEGKAMTLGAELEPEPT